MPHSETPSTPAATFTAIDEKLTTAEPAALSLDQSSTSNEPGSLPYWLMNIPRNEWPAECPDFLRNLPEKNIQILSTPDERYRRQDWELVKEFIRTNRIERFQRLPSDLRKYLEYTTQIKARYGSVMRFVVKERLRWGDGDDLDALKPKGRPFKYAEDIKTLYNDWPYGVEEGIIHLVVWVKFELEDDPATDDLTPRARKEIDDYVKETFCSRVPPERVVWFKNWKSLKSVHAIEHFHVMLYQPDMDFVREITGGDVPLIATV
ncbi:GIG1 family protein [Aspergillus chevalieri]|uniref:N-acetylglucosamine-induced protein 1 n=1 Tax=Aspergillus chevalieri TaxID=182096 RepID=A0A7R7ZL39_ASPCH|nr:uncharacterized protein ACHE_20677A [Aspergillus chevalieri]BCR85219.1 hypothetical protein ACHE_20677A [Aspergillus chevalieri]